MESHRIYTHRIKGFSIIEVLIALALLVLVLSLGLMASMDSYRRYIFRTENQILVSGLAKARSESLTNKNQSPHGMCFDKAGRRFVLFEGSSYGTGLNPIFIEVNTLTTISSVPDTFSCTNGGVIFSQLSGTTSQIEIVMNQYEKISTTTITNVGTIHW